MLPTFCAIAGVSLPEGYQPDGENVLPALLGKEFKRHKPILWENHVTSHGDAWPQLAVIKDHWRLAMTKDGRRVELYDLFTDWGEKENLAAKYPVLANQLQRIAVDYNKSLPPMDQFDKRLCIPEVRRKE